jgi:hypothetical protein
LTTSNQKYAGHIQGTLTDQVWSWVHVSLLFALCWPLAQQQKVQCDRDQWGSSRLFLHIGSDQLWTRFANSPNSCKPQITVGQAGILAERLHPGAIFITAVWKDLSIVTTCQ